MIDFLVISGIKIDTINKLSQNPSDVFDLSANKEECVKIITFLKLIGIKNVDELLLNSLGLFFKTKEEVINLFSKHNVEELVNSINEDPNNIDILFQ